VVFFRPTGEFLEQICRSDWLIQGKLTLCDLVVIMIAIFEFVISSVLVYFEEHGKDFGAEVFGMNSASGESISVAKHLAGVS